MSDHSDPGTPPPPPRRTRVAEAADAVSDGVMKIGRLQPQQAFMIMGLVTLTFMFVMMAWESYSQREERRGNSAAMQERFDAQTRDANSQVELTRHHCSAESRQLREYFSGEREKDRTFQANERDKDRRQWESVQTAITGLTQRLTDLEKFLGRKLGAMGEISHILSRSP